MEDVEEENALDEPLVQSAQAPPVHARGKRAGKGTNQVTFYQSETN